jgi:uncharacterized membrane protein YfcA
VSKAPSSSSRFCDPRSIDAALKFRRVGATSLVVGAFLWIGSFGSTAEWDNAVGGPLALGGLAVMTIGMWLGRRDGTWTFARPSRATVIVSVIALLVFALLLEPS